MGVCVPRRSGDWLVDRRLFIAFLTINIFAVSLLATKLRKFNIAALNKSMCADEEHTVLQGIDANARDVFRRYEQVFFPSLSSHIAERFYDLLGMAYYIVVIFEWRHISVIVRPSIFRITVTTIANFVVLRSGNVGMSLQTFKSQTDLPPSQI